MTWKKPVTASKHSDGSTARLPILSYYDLMLPFVGGAVVQQEIASHVFTRDIPVVIITGSGKDLSDLQVACVLRKPVTPEELVRTVASCLTSGAPGSRS